ncbi:SH3 domain-containing protein [Pacificibacter marinus]|uniref:Bacterial SH3 domain protein n=1 Tax=Pacificibacter marinus TaxID=658057 RepID=A0A1Y5SDZ0_9RHOB|nr:SH3 domain-containing protein [Pacificibacter marinus]SEK50394.1 SH3-like domain-containing protein [Pacificibacter marinus]SLN37473.1 Bacterial SH3 domain protein [Pacificibacter marinus]
MNILALRPSIVAARFAQLCLGFCIVMACLPTGTFAQTAPAATESEQTPNAQPPEPQKPVAAIKRGNVTNLPLPRFVSLKATEANARRGPSLSHRIDWVFKLRGYPLEVIAEYGHWRRVRDFEDATGWVHYSLISGVRTALVQQETVDLHARPDQSSRLTAQAEKGAVLRLLECDIDWCKASADGHKGWLRKTGLWGIGGDEILD